MTRDAGARVRAEGSSSVATHPGPLKKSGTTTRSGSRLPFLLSVYFPVSFLVTFVISDGDTRIEGEEFLQKEVVSDDLESQAEIPENYTSDVSQEPQLREPCGDVLERDWGLPDDSRWVPSLCQEDFTPEPALLKSPLGEGGLDCANQRDIDNHYSYISFICG